ncbi:hypothetical protein ROHU_008291 [Labeo rohita]|uniref:Uncharacterized protein n=1 Tax=Labeo rohita TaxID=84645 RepID=A0A498M6Q3_LABRO|nr:hypothetical protein ROHU_008291 [Labeo rohita]
MESRKLQQESGLECPPMEFMGTPAAEQTDPKIPMADQTEQQPTRAEQTEQEPTRVVWAEQKPTRVEQTDQKHRTQAKTLLPREPTNSYRLMFSKSSRCSITFSNAFSKCETRVTIDMLLSSRSEMCCIAYSTE